MLQVSITEDWKNPITEWHDVKDMNAAIKWIREWGKANHRFVKQYTRTIIKDKVFVVDFGDYKKFGLIKINEEK